MIRLEGKRDLFYLIDKIIQSNEFWKINYYLRSMKKAPHGGVMHVFHPNLYLRHYSFQPHTFVADEPENIPYFMKEIVEYALSIFYECDDVNYEDLLQYCFSGNNWYIGYRLLHMKSEYVKLNKELHGTLLWDVLGKHKRLTDYFYIDTQYAMYGLVLCLVAEKAITIKNVSEILKHEQLRDPHNKYGLTKLDNIKFLRQGFRVDDIYYQYNIFIDPTIASPTDTMPYTFRIITDEILNKELFMRCDENLAVPYTEMLSTASMDFQKFHGITADFAHIDTLLNKEVIVHIHPTLAHKILMIIKPDKENGTPFYHIEVEELWSPNTLKDDVVLATFIHAKFFPHKKAFSHIDFSINQYNTDVYIAKYEEVVNETGIPIDKYGDVHYKIWCVEADFIKPETWSKLVCATLDEPFREIFFEMFRL